jgi:hypothetical protein
MLVESREPLVQDVARFTNRPRPTFLYIGGDRCGSKSLHGIFRQHPDCYVPSIADPYFFDKHYDRGLDWYLSLFKDAPDDAKAIGEFSHDYLHSEDAAKRIANDLPEVKLLVTLRHPIERTFSSYVGAYSAGATRLPFKEAIRSDPMFIGNSLYADKLTTYFDVFPPNRVLVQFFDDLEANTEAFATRAFEFVGLPASSSIDYGTRLAKLSSPRFPFAGVLSRQAAHALRRLGWVDLLGQLKNHPLVRPIFYRPFTEQDRPVMGEETRKHLQRVFAPQIDRLEKMLNRNLSHWRQ